MRRRFISCRRFAGVELVWNIDDWRPAVDCTVHYNWSDLLLDKTWLPTKPISSVLNICINRGIIDTVVLIAPFSFPHTNQLGKSLIVIIWYVTTVFICRVIALIQMFYIIIHVTHNFQHCLSHFAYYSMFWTAIFHLSSSEVLLMTRLYPCFISQMVLWWYKTKNCLMNIMNYMQSEIINVRNY